MRMPGVGRRSATRGLILAVGLAALLAGCGGNGAPAASSPSSGPLLPATPTALPRETPGQFKDLLAELRGKPVVVNVWASWCGPCIAEAPALAGVAARFGSKVQFIGVDVADQAGPARAFIRRYHLPYPSVFDPDRSIVDALGFIAQPVTVIYAPDGRVAFGPFSGPIPTRTLTAQLEKLL